MVEEVQLWWKLRQIERRRCRVSGRYVDLIKRALDADKDALLFEQGMLVREIDEEIEEMQNEHLFRIARRLLLVIPVFDNEGINWEQSSLSGKWHLTREALTMLRNSVRAEQKARREQWNAHVVWLTAIAGVLGTLTGLISVLFFHTSK
jgi:hypothetical protein